MEPVKYVSLFNLYLCLNRSLNYYETAKLCAIGDDGYSFNINDDNIWRGTIMVQWITVIYFVTRVYTGLARCTEPARTIFNYTFYIIV